MTRIHRKAHASFKNPENLLPQPSPTHFLICLWLSGSAKEIASDTTSLLVHEQLILLGKHAGAISNHRLSISQLEVNYIISLVFIGNALMVYKRG